ncbi:hypothetical protein QSE00_23040 [Arenibacter sp. M-2]|uniref:hypothetical protein n=1 Tax=Arenibacter sp. M-2 TaxID=3053612 RepID=UPI0025705113|nr:hypothetical protein [Arenibacter sp. M-2]MDL5514705.1 hypothetical protein [Arenibacter sp. M-2]
MKLIFFLLILSLSFNALGQELDCGNFKNGVYYAEILEPFPVKWKVTREGNQQIEEVIEIPEEAKKAGYPMHPQYEDIEWIDDCTYRLKYDSTKFELSQSQKMINDNGGVLTKIVKIENNCYYYISTLAIDGKEKTMEGKLCLE